MCSAQQQRFDAGVDRRVRRPRALAHLEVAARPQQHSSHRGLASKTIGGGVH
jgi:hypothetical protein